MKTIFLPLLVLLSAATVMVERQTLAVDDVRAPLLVLRSGKWGFIDRSGRIIVKPQFDIPPQFESAEPFSEGVAAVCCVGGRTVYIDRSGRMAFNATFPRGPLRAGKFLGGIALVEIDGVGAAYIDRAGRLIAPVRDDH